MLIRFRKIPFTCSYPSFQSHSAPILVAYVFGFFFFTDYLPQMETWSLLNPWQNHRVRSPASPRSCWRPPIPQTNTRHRQALNFRGAFPVHLLVIEYPVNHAKLWLRTGVHFVLWTSSHRIAPCSATLVQEAVRRCGFEPRINGHVSENEDSDLSRRSLRRVASSCSMRA